MTSVRHREAANDAESSQLERWDTSDRVVRLLSDAEGLHGLSVREPRSDVSLSRLHCKLLEAGVQVHDVRLAAHPDRIAYEIQFREADGARVSRPRWVALRDAVMSCVMAN